MKNKIEEIKTETSGFGFGKRYRTTSQDEEGNIAVGDLEPSKAEAVRDSRERLGEIKAKQNQK